RRDGGGIGGWDGAAAAVRGEAAVGVPKPAPLDAARRAPVDVGGEIAGERLGGRRGGQPASNLCAAEAQHRSSSEGSPRSRLSRLRATLSRWRTVLGWSASAAAISTIDCSPTKWRMTTI